MTENPYDILGLPHDAPLDEVKRAYRKKARENHPDLNPDDPAAEERMNKINEAYDRITNPDKYAASDARKRGYGAPYTPGYNGYGSPGGSSSAGGPSHGGSQAPYDSPGADQYTWTTINFDDLFGGGWGTASGPIHPEAAAADSPEVRQAIYQINTSNYADAINILQRIPSTGRDARWNYLFALANNGAGKTVAAHDHIKRARQMDPQNPDYIRAEQSFSRRAQTYAQQGTERGFTTVGLDPNWICCCVCLGPACCSYMSRLLMYSGACF